MDKLQSLLTVDEVATYLRVKKQTVLKWVSQDKIPSIKIGRFRMFDPDEIRKWVKRRTSAA